eukprot:260378_1
MTGGPFSEVVDGIEYLIFHVFKIRPAGAALFLESSILPLLELQLSVAVGIEALPVLLVLLVHPFVTLLPVGGEQVHSKPSHQGRVELTTEL